MKKSMMHFTIRISFVQSLSELKIRLFLLTVLSFVWINSFSQGFGINAATPATALDVNGDIAIRISGITCVNGNNNNISVAGFSFIRITGPTSAFTITGLTGGVNGKMVIIYNSTGFDMIISNQDANSTAGNRVICSDASSTTVKRNGCVTLIYSATDSRWILVSMFKN